MENTVRAFVVILAIVLSCAVVQGARAETETVSGSITSITIRPPTVVIDDGTDDGIEIAGLRYYFLCNHYDICLAEGDDVIIEYFEYECSDGTIINKACKITLDNATIVLRACK